MPGQHEISFKTLRSRDHFIHNNLNSDQDGMVVLKQQHGIAWIPAYGWISGLLPLIPLPDNINALGEDYQRAVAAYRLL